MCFNEAIGLSQFYHDNINGNINEVIMCDNLIFISLNFVFWKKIFSKLLGNARTMSVVDSISNNDPTLLFSKIQECLM